MRRLGTVLALLGLTAGALAGCASDGSSHSVNVRVGPHTSTLTQPVAIRITGVDPDQVVTVRLSSTDGGGRRWSSSAEFRSTGHTLDLTKATPVRGDYRGVDGMGLVETLKPTGSDPDALYAWHGQQTFQLSVAARSGTVLGHATFLRRLPGVRSTHESVADHGFDGTFFRPEGPTPYRSPLLVFGGSEGGNQMGGLGRVLAAAGHPVLTLAYFHAPGLPRNLVKIPLEYFAHALRWLGGRPGVDPRHIYILGVSRGSEAAQIVAVHYPGLVQGVVLGSPSGVVEEGLTGGLGLRGKLAGASAWSYRGKPIPYARTTEDPHPNVVPAAVIPVERIRGPIFLTCGGFDQIWVSCPFSHAIVKRLDAHRVPYRHELAAYPDAGHYVGSFVPYEPSGGELTGPGAGRHPWSNPQALARVWPRLLRFLDGTTKHAAG